MNRAVPLLVACLAAVAATAAGIPPAAAQEAQPAAAGAAPEAVTVNRIAAVVNDDVITTAELLSRVRLAQFAAGLPDTPENRQRLLPQVLRGLVDEKLQLQEARARNVSVGAQEIEQALARIAEQNRVGPDQLRAMLAEQGIPASALEDQIRAALAWSKLVQRRLRPMVEIGDEEIDAELARIEANAGKPEYHVAEIFLAVDSPANDEEVRRLAGRLVEQIRQGASFPAVAAQFSQAAGAAGGGDLGWVQPGQLAPELEEALRQMRPGQVSPPIRTLAGYHILLVRDQRLAAAGDPGDVKLNLKQLFLPFPAGADDAARTAIKSQAEDIARGLSGCDAIAAKAEELASPVSGDLGTVRLAELPPDLARVVGGLPIGQPSPVLTNDSGALVLMVCEREAPPSSLPSRTDIANAIGQERMDMLQRRLLRDLRQAAFIDLRI